MNSKLQEYALIAEIIGGVAIVASLIFVGVQLRQNTIATQGNTRNELIAADLAVLLAPNGTDAAIALRSLDDITEEQAVEAVIYLTALLRVREFVWLQYRSGLLDHDTWQAYLSGISSNFNNPRARRYWEMSKAGFDPQFVAEVDKFLVNVPADERFSFDMEAMQKGIR